MSPNEALPTPAHIPTEFLLWLWWISESGSGYYNFKHTEESSELFGDGLDSIDIWVDNRIAMRNPSELKVSAVITGDNPSAAPESKVALFSGKVIAELRLGVRVDDREYFFTLKGQSLMLGGVKLPCVVVEGGGEVIFERLALIEELDLVIASLFRDFSRERIGSNWHETASEISNWLE